MFLYILPIYVNRYGLSWEMVCWGSRPGIRDGRVADLPQVEPERDIVLQPDQALGQQGLFPVLAQLEQGSGGPLPLTGLQHGS